MPTSTVAVRFTGDVSNLRRAVGDADGTLSGFSSRIGGWAAGIGAAFAGAFAVDTIVDFSTRILTLGAQLETWRLKVSTVFEEHANTIRQWADENNEAFGLTDDALAGVAAGFGDLLKPMGFTAAEAAVMSVRVVGLAGALSAWTGGTRDAADVAEILASAMLGEREALKGLGIAISEADVQARIAAKGQQDLEGSARQMAEAVATQELIFERSTDAQRAWTEDANKSLLAQNNLKAAVGELWETLAVKLAPVLADIANWLAGELPKAIERIETWVQTKLIPAWEDFYRGWQEIWPEMQATFEASWFMISGSIEQEAKLLAELMQITDHLKNAWTYAWETMGFITESIVNGILIGIEATINGVVDAVNTLLEMLDTLHRRLFAIPGLSSALQGIRSSTGDLGFDHVQLPRVGRLADDGGFVKVVNNFFGEPDEWMKSQMGRTARKAIDGTAWDVN